MNIDDYELIDIKGTSLNTEQGILKKETEREVNLIVGKLEDKFKLPIIMHYTVEMSLDEIAKSLKIPKGTVKSRLYHARKAILKCLEAADHE